jgi:glycosyltransferase involved in cell wall biosynthesis
VNNKTDHVRVLYSFPHKLGGGRIQTTAWEQVKGLIEAGAEVVVHPAVLQVPVPGNPVVRPTLSVGKLRLPYKLLGTLRTCALHDRIVARRLRNLAGKIDIVHLWPLGATETIRTAAEMGIPTVLERANAHTRFAYEVVEAECKRIGVPLPPGHEHAFNRDILEREEEEYNLAYRLLCPSEFVVKTFLDQGFKRKQLVRHFYGVDEHLFYPGSLRSGRSPFTMIFVGVCAVRKGLHFALEAWLRSPASRDGKFLIAGSFIPAYEEKLRPMLTHPSVQVLGHREDIADLMRNSDAFVLPTIEEGFGLVCTEAMASGCVPVISEACTDICKHMENSLVHSVGDVDKLAQHITMLYEDRALLLKLREAGLRDVPQISWSAAGQRLLALYREIIAEYREGRSSTSVMAGSASPATQMVVS